MTMMGTSKVTPKARNIVSTKEKYFSMSVIQATPSGANCAMKPNTIGKKAK